MSALERILVTGGAGLVGGHLCAASAETYPQATRALLLRFGERGGHEDFVAAVADLVDEAAIDKLIARLDPDLIILARTQFSIGQALHAAKLNLRVKTTVRIDGRDQFSGITETRHIVKSRNRRSSMVISVLGASMPRSGHHLVEQILLNYFNEAFGYCEFYGVSCCKSIPCNRVVGSNVKIFLQKSHDFDLMDPIDVPGSHRLVQYRSPIPRTLSNYELYLNSGYEDNIRNFRNFLVSEAVYFRRFYRKWIESRDNRFFFLSYEQLTGDPLGAISSFLRHVGCAVETRTLSDGVSKSIGIRGRENVPYRRVEVYEHRYAAHPVLANFEDNILKNCHGYFPPRYFSTIDSDSSLIGNVVNARIAFLAGNLELAEALAQDAYAQDADDPQLLALLSRVKADRANFTGHNTQVEPDGEHEDSVT